MTVLAIEYIISTPDTCSSKPRIASTRTRVLDIAYFHNAGWSIEKIAYELELTPAQIHAALSYYSATPTCGRS